MERPGVELATSRSQVRRPNHYIIHQKEDLGLRRYNCKEAELLHITKIKRIPNLLPSGMFRVPNSKQVELLRWEGRGRERMERNGGTGRGQLAAWVQRDRRPNLTAVNTAFLRFGVTQAIR